MKSVQQVKKSIVEEQQIKKDTKLLPKASHDIREESSTKLNSRNVFLESLKASSKKFAKNRESQQTENIQIKQNKNKKLA